MFLIDDGTVPTTAVAPAKPGRRQRSSQLQDITEEEEVSSSSDQPLPPPQNLELDRQFVEGDGYGVALTWAPPSPIPPHATGYNIYVNGELMSCVEGAEQSSVIISGVPRKQVSSNILTTSVYVFIMCCGTLQLVKITVHTISEEGESSASSKPIILNPRE